MSNISGAFTAEEGSLLLEFSLDDVDSHPELLELAYQALVQAVAKYKYRGRTSMWFEVANSHNLQEEA